MKKNVMKKIYAKIGLLLSVIMVNSSAVFADVGNTMDYSSGVTSDSSSVFFIFAIIRSLGLVGTLILIAAIVVALYFIKKKGLLEPLMEIINGIRGVSSGSGSVNGVQEDSIIGRINKTDEYFDCAQFKGRVSNMYVSLQEAWEKKNWKIARPFETDQLFRTHANMLNEYIEKKQTNVMDRISIEDIKIIGYSEYPSSNMAQIKVQIKASQVDYIRDDKTGNVLAGNPNRPVNCTYEWELTRKLTVKSNQSNGGMEATCCPSCGAPMSIGAAGSCDYCGAQVSTGQYDWVLNGIRKTSQR